MFNDLPDGFDIDGKVVMHQHIAKPCNGPSRDFGRGCLAPVRNALAGFSHQLEIAYDGILHHAGGSEACSIALGILLHPVDTLQHV